MSTEPLLKIAAAYIRVSDERQDEYSPDSQIKLARERAERDGYMIPDEYVFYDDGISGKSTKLRAEFNRMIAIAKEKDHPFDRIYVWKFSRFARNQEQSIVYKNLLRKTGVEVMSVSEPIPEGPFGDLIERIIEWMDEYYSINLGVEVTRGMTEKVTGVLNIQLKAEAKVLVSDNAETTVLAFDEWHGIGLYPELLATFVTPNHPELSRIIARATDYLGKWTGDTSMDGYQSQDPNRVLSQAAAIFTAIKEQAIAYVVPPASFEQVGQRVRLCDMVLQQKLGTCLDLTLLYAACLEAVGLHPLLITTQGHIFTGLWLEERMFPECVQDDVSLIKKRLASGVNEIAVVETTCVTTGKDFSFDHARTIGEQNLATQQLECIIDVHRARMSRISPLPQRIHSTLGWVIQHDTSFKEENMVKEN